MRQRLPVAFLVIVSACGGSSPTTTPPPGGTTPAVISIQAGDGQGAEPGATLTIKPVVLVKDAAGRVVGGVAVSFTVDSGGGSLQASSATTAADGTASPGDWHLGTGEGRNVMSASAGSLAKVTFVATAVLAPVTVPSQTVATSGGAITISQPGPLHGFSLNIPSGAYAASTTWAITYRSASTITKSAVMNPVSPIIHLTGTATGYSANLLTITIPATIPANTFPVIILRDPSTGLIEALPTIGYDSSSVTAVTRHLNAAYLLKNTAAWSGGLRGHFAALNGGYDVEVIVSALTRAELDADIDTGFRPGTDDWGFENPGTFFQPDGICSGMTLTAMWYFANKKADGDLSHRLDRALGVSISNRGGIRWSSRVNAAQTLGVYDNAVLAAIDAAKKSPGVTAGQIRYDMIKAQLHVSHLPQLVIVSNHDLNHAVMAYRTVGTTIYITDPNVPGGLDQSVRFAGTEFAPYSMPSTTGTGPTMQMPYIAGIAVSALFEFGALPDEYDQAVDGSIDETIFPVTEMRNRFGVLSDTIYVADTMATWVQCAACQSYPAPAGLTGTSGPLAAMTLFRDPGGNRPWSLRGETVANLLNPATFANPGDFRYGYAIMGNSPSNAVWIDWKTFIVRKLGASITPAAPTDVVGNPISFAMEVTPNKLPSEVIYRWDFNDGSATVSIENSNTLQHAFPHAGSFVMTAQILDAGTQQPVAKATTTVTITAPLLAWKFTSASVAYGLSQPPVVQYGSYDSRWAVDSIILGRIAQGVTQGGIRLVDQAFSPPGLPSRTAPVGLYLLEGPSITLANLLNQASLDAFIVTGFASASTNIPAAPQVSGWNLLQQGGPVNPLCQANEDTYGFSGTVTAGHLVGLRVPLCFQQNDAPWVNGLRLLALDADVTFTGATASGTLNMTWYFYGNFNVGTYFQRTARLTFTATRVVN